MTDQKLPTISVVRVGVIKNAQRVQTQAAANASATQPLASFGYNPTLFTHIKGSIVSFDSICHHAVSLYSQRINSGGLLPRGAKTSYAKQILLHHPGRSLKTTRNLVSVAAAIQDKYSWLLEVWYKNEKKPYGFSIRATAALAEHLKKDLADNGYKLSLGPIESYINRWNE